MIIVKTKKQGITVYILVSVDAEKGTAEEHGTFLSEAGARSQILKMGLSPAKIRVVKVEPKDDEK